jgi:hypothetical protein
MFRDEGLQLKQLLEDSQRQLFTLPRRIVRLLEVFVKEIDTWFENNILLTRAESKWLWDTPLFLYPHDEVMYYVRNCYFTDKDRKAQELAEGIVECIDNYILFSEKSEVTHKRQIYKLFQPSREVDRAKRYTAAMAIQPTSL